MKLYELPRFTYFTLKDDPDKNEFFFDRVDGMYSICFSRFQDIIHIAAYAEVEIINE